MKSDVLLHFFARKKKEEKTKRVKHFPLLVLPCRGMTIIKEIKNKLSKVTAADRGSLLASRFIESSTIKLEIYIKRNRDYKHYT